MSLSHIYYTIQYYGGENINKIAIITLIIVAIGLVAGGFALVANGDVSSVADNPVSNEASNSSGDNASLDNSTVVKDVLSDNNMNNHFSLGNIQKEISLGSIPKEISLGSIPKEISSGNAVQMINNVAGNASTQSINVAAYAASTGDSRSVVNIGNNQPYDPWSNINKSDYTLSPYYNEHIFVKMGEDFTDMFAFCVADGVFIPLGNITKAISENHICDQSCGIGDCYFDLSSPYIYNYDDVSYYLEHGEFASDVITKQQNYIRDYYANNYKQLEDHEDIYLNVNQDFTDKYILCMDCGRYVPLGNVTTPLKDVMICNHSTHFGQINYFDVDNMAVITPEQAIDSWYPFYEELYSNPDYHPMHSDEPGYGEDANVQDDNINQNDNSFEDQVAVNDQPIDFNLVVYTGNIG